MIVEQGATEPSEPDLVGRAREGNGDAFNDLVLQHQAAVRAFVARYVRGRETIDDLAQECFVAAHRGLAGYRADAPFRMWLLGIARRQVMSFLREEIRRRRHEQGGFEAAVAQWQVDSVESEHLPLAEHQREMQALQGCMKKLARRDAELVNAFYFKARTSVQIADRLGLKESGVRMTLLRIRQALRDCVKGRLASGEL